MASAAVGASRCQSEGNSTTRRQIIGTLLAENKVTRLHLNPCFINYDSTSTEDEWDQCNTMPDLWVCLHQLVKQHFHNMVAQAVGLCGQQFKCCNEPAKERKPFDWMVQVQQRKPGAFLGKGYSRVQVLLVHAARLKIRNELANHLANQR